MGKVLRAFLLLEALFTLHSVRIPFSYPFPTAPCPEVYNLLKDKEGYIWMAHDFGISRYDGTNFVSFSNPGEMLWL